MRSGPTRGCSAASSCLGVAPGPADDLCGDESVQRVDVDVGPRPAGDAGQAQQRAPLVRRLARRFGVEHRRRVVGHVADGQLVEREVVVRARERRGRRQHDVGVARGLVEVDVEREHEVQALQGPVQPRAVGRGQHRVARDGDQRADLALARRLHLLREHPDRQLAEHLGRPADARVPAPGPEALAAPARPLRVGRARGRAREHRPAHAVEVAGERVEHVDQPRGQRPELLRAGADAAVHRRARGARERARHALDRRRRDPGHVGHRAGGEVRRQRQDLVDAGEVVDRRDQALGLEHVHEREQEQGVGAGPDEQVLVGLLGGARAPRVDDHDPSAAGAQRSQPAAHVRRGHQRAVGGQRVGPEHEQVVGAVQVGHRHAQPAAEHEPGRDLLGHLVDGRGRVEVLRAQRLEQRAAVDRSREGVRGGVAQVHGDGVVAAGLAHRPEPLVDDREGLVPGGLATVNQRHAQPVGVLVQGLERDPLRAQEPVREHVLGVAADALHLPVGDLDREPTRRFAQRARPEGRSWQERNSAPAG